MFSALCGLGSFGMRITIALIRVGVRLARVALKAFIAVALLSIVLVFSMSRMIGT